MTEKIVKPAVNWGELEPHYRAGKRSLKDIGAEFGCSDAAIIKHAKKHKWSRNLQEKIKQRALQKVSDSEVSAVVSAQTKITEEIRVEVESELQANIIRGERKDISKYRGLITKLFTELDASTDNIELMEQIGELMAAPDEAGIDKINELYRKVVSLPGRVDMAKKLVETFEKLINAERKVFNIRDDDDTDNNPTQFNEIKLIAVWPNEGRLIEG